MRKMYMISENENNEKFYYLFLLLYYNIKAIVIAPLQGI